MRPFLFLTQSELQRAGNSENFCFPDTMSAHQWSTDLVIASSSLLIISGIFYPVIKSRHYSGVTWTWNIMTHTNSCLTGNRCRVLCCLTAWSFLWALYHTHAYKSSYNLASYSYKKIYFSVEFCVWKIQCIVTLLTLVDVTVNWVKSLGKYSYS